MHAAKVARMSARWLAVVLALALSACTTLRWVKTTVDTPEGVRVTLQEVTSDIFRLEVINYGAQPILVDRDRVVLETPGGARARLPGGVGSLYTIGPSGHHAVNVRFDLSGLRGGDRVGICFADAITSGGRAVGVPPIELAIE
jgi:hypothetical protein